MVLLILQETLVCKLLSTIHKGREKTPVTQTRRISQQLLQFNQTIPGTPTTPHKNTGTGVVARVKDHPRRDLRQSIRLTRGTLACSLLITKHRVTRQFLQLGPVCQKIFTIRTTLLKTTVTVVVIRVKDHLRRGLRLVETRTIWSTRQCPQLTTMRKILTSGWPKGPSGVPYVRKFRSRDQLYLRVILWRTRIASTLSACQSRQDPKPRPSHSQALTRWKIGIIRRPDGVESGN